MKLIQELDHYAKLREDLNDLATPKYTVYKAYGPNTEKVYYGYVKGGEKDVRDEFFGRTKSGESGVPEDEKRGINVLINANGGAEGIEFEELAVVDSEPHAHALRNDERDADPEAVTKKSVLPIHVHRAGQEQHPEIYARMHQRQQEREDEKNQLKLSQRADRAGSVQKAWAEGYFTKEQINPLKTNPEARADFTALPPSEFAKKYGLKFNAPFKKA